MIKKHRVLMIMLLVLFVSIFGCCVAFNQYYASREASVQINGYRIDFMYSYDPEFIATYLKITQPGGKSAEVMQKIQHVECPRLAIQRTNSRLYFLCSDQVISGSPFYSVPYLDIETMLLYDSERDDTPTPIDSLDFR
jgi:hypothetical protein